ncbi:MAG: helix-turn-helix transcriptional regulator [Niabella sp.]|nr:helix-turn-helix transcriptional regulator [Niabella sp.]
MTRRTLKHSFSLLHVDAVKLGRHWDFSNVLSPYSRIYFIDEGEGYVSTAGGKQMLEAGHLYLIPSFTLCNLKCSKFLSQYFIHFFEDSRDGISLFQNNRKCLKIKAAQKDISNIKRLLEMNPNRKIYRSDNPKVYEQNAYYKEYQALNSKQSDADFMETQGVLLQLISSFLNSKEFEHRNTGDIPSKVLYAINYIQINLHEKLSVADLSKKTCLQGDYFSRIFYQHTGSRPLNYIQSKRIERAQYLIATTNMSFSEIAQDTGFENLPHFFRLFKKITNLTPREYAHQNKLLSAI